MGERKRKTMHFDEKKLLLIQEYISGYMYSLRTLISLNSDYNFDVIVPEFIPLGNAVIWPCTDGVIVLIYHNSVSDINIKTETPLSKTMNEFMENGHEFKLYNIEGHPVKETASIHLNKPSSTNMRFGGMKLETSSSIYQPKFDNGFIIGWDTTFSKKPDVAALEYFRGMFVPKNIIGKQDIVLDEQKAKFEAKGKANELLLEYQRIVNSAKSEEQIQEFLKGHPEFLYPDYIKCFPKFKLGEDYITDYVFLIQGYGGLEYVFVEIEKVEKDIFTKGGQFTADFTQAKNQMLDWDNWITKNHAYLSSKLPKLYKPKFHLVLGRDILLSQELKEKLHSEFHSTNRSFSTYDDLALRFEIITKQLLL